MGVITAIRKVYLIINISIFMPKTYQSDKIFIKVLSKCREFLRLLAIILD